MWDIFEPEEFVGKYWDQWVGAQTSYAPHEDATVRLDDIRVQIGVFFRGIGGDAGIELGAASAQTKQHRLSLRMKLGIDREKMETARIDGQSLTLPAGIDYFADRDINKKLYYWLAAFLSHASHHQTNPQSRLHADLVTIRQAVQTAQKVIETLPGLTTTYTDLCSALAEVRPHRKLPRFEAAMEQVVQSALGGPAPDDRDASLMWQFILGEISIADVKVSCPAKYRPFLPVPLWGEAVSSTRIKRGDNRNDELADPDAKDERDGKKRKAVREKNEQAERDDPFILDRFEKILSMAQMVNVNRAIDDDEDENALDAADDLDELTLSDQERKIAASLKLDLELAPEEVDTTALTGPKPYPEWDYTRQSYHRDHCLVECHVAEEEGESWVPDAAALRRIRRIKKQFEALRPRRVPVHGQLDGAELDVDAAIRAACDLAANGEGSDQIFTSYQKQARDLAASILVDVSLSTDAWVENRRVLDVEKEALTTLAHGLDASGDDYSIETFTSRSRTQVSISTVKQFDERFSESVVKRIAALTPGYYTRMGAAIRHTTEKLAERPNSHRLLLMLTDGKPNDIDHYEGRYGIEDTRKAIQEARHLGLTVFGITVDEKARDYFPYMFGAHGCAIISHIDGLTATLPRIFRSLTV